MARRLRQHWTTIVVAMITAMVTAGAPAIAHGVNHALFAHDSDKVDGKHAVASGATITQRKGKLVATNTSTGRLPNNIIAKAQDADKLDGLDSSSFGRSGGRVISKSFTEQQELSLAVPGYGTFYLFCNDNDTPTTPGDDLVTYGYSHVLGPGALNGERSFFASSPLDTAPKISLFNSDAGNGGTIALRDDRVQVDQYLSSANGDKVIRVSAWGWEDATSTVNCIGMIEAQILR